MTRPMRKWCYRRTLLADWPTDGESRSEEILRRLLRDRAPAL